MKTPKATKLKSGNWRVQVQVNGKRYSCTGETKKEAQEKAKQVYAGAEIKKRNPLTVGEAIDKYIETKKGVLSPSTIKGYLSVRKNYFKEIMDINLSDLTQADIQLAVSAASTEGKSPKTIRNAHGLLAAALDEFAPDFSLRTRLPQKQKSEIRIFSEDEMAKVWNAAKGSKYEIAILLASWMGLRMSEVRGVKFCDIQDGRLHVHTAIVSGPDGDVEKGPKTESGDRWIKIPSTILNKISAEFTERYGEMNDENIQNYICPYAAITIYKNFIDICKKAKVEPCRFHDLRHFSASEAHALGVPDKYSMRRMGHKTDNMLKTVYQHTMKDKEDEFGDLIDKKMEQLYYSD